MRIDIMTLFPEMFEPVIATSIIGRARAAGKLDIRCHHIRDYTLDRHGRTDDTPYGGGKGMLMQADPIYNCYRAVLLQLGGARPHVVYMSPGGRTLTQKRAVELSQLPNLCILCGHYEGVDQRVLDEIADEELSIGDYVLTGGELPALVLTDCIGRLCEGVLADDICWQEESHSEGLLEYPHYTKPYEWNGRTVPDILLSGHHANIANWRREQSLDKTRRVRPDLLAGAPLSERDRAFLDTLKAEELEGEDHDGRQSL
ncbi:MAG: tRNA (guanosine(37)-N1)-methyltransferase TrmD [Oscillospiraceae bacterium]|jgi:tRNA (guanine37-N1)-methyltransferase|nr:tRNA (guanosine(37)-N1)-methyltransferase TrmD [Oscillospiraceae bacterium]